MIALMSSRGNPSQFYASSGWIQFDLCFCCFFLSILRYFFPLKLWASNYDRSKNYEGNSCWKSTSKLEHIHITTVYVLAVCICMCFPWLCINFKHFHLLFKSHWQIYHSNGCRILICWGFCQVYWIFLSIVFLIIFVSKKPVKWLEIDHYGTTVS